MGVEELLICPAEDGNVFIPVCNKTGEVMKIVQNTMLGDVYPIREEGGKVVVDNFTETSTCALTFHQERIAGNRKFTLEESQDKLLSILRHNVVSPDLRTKRVWDCAGEFCDVFALEDEDRGEVMDIEHHVHHPLSVQPPHRVPFVLCEKISAFVQLVLE